MQKYVVHNAPLVSVCVPTFNRARKLERAVIALLNCSYRNLEIIISDNHSGDETPAVCAALVEKDARVRCFRQESNLGPTKNFEYARSQAAGKYFLWHGDDDRLDDDYIRVCVNLLEEDDSLVLVSGVAAYRREGGELNHFGNVIQLESRSRMLRMLKYLWQVADNAVFCGVYRTGRVGGCTVPNCLAGDWAWIAEVLICGRAKMLTEVHVHRDFGDSTSISYERIVAVLGAPLWQARFPWVGIGINVAGYLAFKSEVFRRCPWVVRVGLYALVFSLLLVKGAVVPRLRWIAARMPFARRIYRRYSKRSGT